MYGRAALISEWVFNFFRNWGASHPCILTNTRNHNFIFTLHYLTSFVETLAERVFFSSFLLAAKESHYGKIFQCTCTVLRTFSSCKSISFDMLYDSVPESLVHKQIRKCCMCLSLPIHHGQPWPMTWFWDQRLQVHVPPTPVECGWLPRAMSVAGIPLCKAFNPTKGQDLYTIPCAWITASHLRQKHQHSIPYCSLCQGLPNFIITRPPIYQ